VPDTVLVPYKNPVDNARYAYTAARYNRPFDLDTIAQRIGGLGDAPAGTCEDVRAPGCGRPNADREHGG
jgi:hypothetical protein